MYGMLLESVQYFIQVLLRYFLIIELFFQFLTDICDRMCKPIIRLFFVKHKKSILPSIDIKKCSF